MQKESLSTSTAKLVMVVSLILGIGSIIGILGFFWTMQENEIAIKKRTKNLAPVLNNEIVVNSEIEKYLPEGYAIISDNSNYDADIDNDGIEEKIILIKEIEGISEKIIIFKPDKSGYEIIITFELNASSGAFFGEFNVKDVNNNGIPEIIYTVHFGGSGESMPKEANIIGWNGKDYEILLKKDMVLYSYGRSNIGSFSKNFIKDLNNDSIMEVIIPQSDSLYQAYCKYPSPGCVSLLKFDVYKWDGVKYIEATNEFLSVYDEEIKLAEGFLEDPNIQKDSREKIEKYLEEIKDLKEIADWKTYRNEEYGFEVKYPSQAIQSIGSAGEFFATTLEKCADTNSNPYLKGEEFRGCQKIAVLAHTIKANFGSNIEKIKFGGLVGEKFYFRVPQNYTIDNVSIYRPIGQINAQVGNGLYWYKINIEYHLSEEAAAEKLFNQILSTFKFIE